MKLGNLLTHTLLVVALIPARGRGQAPGQPKELAMTAVNLNAGDGRPRVTAKDGSTPTIPGDTVRYRLTFTNLQRDSVHHVQFNDPVPAGLQYVPGSAHADRDDVLVEFSIDQGKTFSKQPMITEVVDGQKVPKPAPASMYTHVRWTLNGWVKPRAQVTAEFNADIKGGASKP